MSLYADDPDVHARYTITDAEPGGENTYTPTVTTGTSTLTSSWEGVASPARVLRVELFGLTAGNHLLRLNVPGGNDVTLGFVSLV